LSLRSAGSERNACAGDDLPDGEIRNATMRWALAVVLDHLVELTAVNLPSVNAYKRLFDYTFAPNRVSWALDNRTVAVRIPAGEADARRLEIRTASSDANRYLIITGALASAAEDFAGRHEHPRDTLGAEYEDTYAARLPNTPDKAVEAFEST